MKLYVVAILVLILQGCTTVTTNPMIHAYAGGNKDFSELSLISGGVSPRSFLKSEEQVEICGANGVMNDGMFENAAESVFLIPGKQVLCIRVATPEVGYLFRSLHDKTIAFETEAGKSYTIKFGVKLPNYIYWVEDSDGNRIESVFIPEEKRGTLCVSSQIGCALACTFCSTAKQGFNRNLSVAEIIGQLYVAQKRLGDEKRITNVVMMGMGEPLLNFDNVVAAMNLMMDDFTFGLSKRRVTVSTSGIVPAMNRLHDVCDVSMAVSLHAANDELRDELVPINQKYPLKELMAACRDYAAQGPRKYITFEYVMLDGINDSLQDARALVKLLKNVPAKINLIPFNPFPNSGYGCSSADTISRFKDVLYKAGLVTTIRKTRGEDIDAACGQLVGKVKDKSRRHLKLQTMSSSNVR